MSQKNLGESMLLQNERSCFPFKQFNSPWKTAFAKLLSINLKPLRPATPCVPSLTIPPKMAWNLKQWFDERTWTQKKRGNKFFKYRKITAPIGFGWHTWYTSSPFENCVLPGATWQTLGGMLTLQVRLEGRSPQKWKSLLLQVNPTTKLSTNPLLTQTTSSIKQIYWYHSSM